MTDILVCLKKLLHVTINALVDKIKNKINLCKLLINSLNLLILLCKYIIPKSVESWNLRNSDSNISIKILETYLVYLQVNSA